MRSGTRVFLPDNLVLPGASEATGAVDVAEGERVPAFRRNRLSI